MSKWIRFEWAMKSILREKANLSILTGMLSELLQLELSAPQVLESEGQPYGVGKIPSIDLFAQAASGEGILFEIGASSEWDYFYRMLADTSRLIGEYLHKGWPGAIILPGKDGKELKREIKRVIAVHLVSFDLGQGEDYLYHGQTAFTGVHRQEILHLSQSQQHLFQPFDRPNQIFPEYYLIKVDKFNDQILARFDEWVYFFKHAELKEGFRAKGLSEAGIKLALSKLNDTEKRQYEHYLAELRNEASMVWSAHSDGHKEGREKGLQEGLAKGLQQGREQGLREGHQQGIVEGLQQGRNEGHEQGKYAGLRQAIRTTLRTRFRNVPGEWLERIDAIKDYAQLEQLFQQALVVDELERLTIRPPSTF